MQCHCAGHVSTNIALFYWGGGGGGCGSLIVCTCTQCSTCILSLHTYSSVQGHGKGHVRIVKERIGKLVLQEGKVTIVTIDGFHGTCQLISTSEPVVQRILVSAPDLSTGGW